MRHFTVLITGIGIGIAIAGCTAVPKQQPSAVPVPARAEAEYIYTFQKDVEAHLKGTDAEKLRYALLLPLRVGILNPSVDRAYRQRILQRIDKLNIKEALPLLEKGLRWNSPYWDGGFIGYAARLWIRFKTAGMADEEKAKFLVSSLRPGYNLRVQSECLKELELFGQIGKQHILNMLSKLDESFSHDNDILISAVLGANLWQSEVLKASRRDIDALARSTNPYVKYVCLSWYSAHSKREAVRLALDLLNTMEAQKYRIRSAMLYGLAYCPGGVQVFTRILSDAQKEPPTTMRDRRVGAVLSYISAGIGGPFKHAPDNLRKEVMRVTDREIQAPRNTWGKELELFGVQHRNRAKAKRILKAWSGGQ